MASQEELDTSKAKSRIDVGARLRSIRTQRGLSLRALAKASGLSLNTLSLIERNRTSPSVSTLQRIAAALGVPITAFFEEPHPARQVIYTPSDARPHVLLPGGHLERLGSGLTGQCAEPFLLVLEPKGSSGRAPIVHLGNEFVFCLAGELTYEVGDTMYVLKPGDSLLFEAQLPHRWYNASTQETRALLVLCTPEKAEDLLRHHLR
ncbi:MAG: helix-turn-helix domain-containing protein [Chloroflexi bacterium]|nr:helix-turn-helix domain-containing protein [Chloroflexota bacterium]